MSAPACRQCGGPCEPERHHCATPVCHTCLPAPAPLRVIPTREQLETEVTRLRAALESIAALQTEEPIHPVENCVYDHFDGNVDDAFEGGRDYGEDQGLWEASEMARAALVTT